MAKETLYQVQVTRLGADLIFGERFTASERPDLDLEDLVARGALARLEPVLAPAQVTPVSVPERTV